MRDDTIIPFPLNPKPSHDKPRQSCPFQAQAELRLAMLRRLFKALAHARVRPELANDVEQQYRHARELLREVAQLYGNALVEAERRARDAQALR
ncbi:hypothetical protein [Pseudomonas sp. GD03944]|uniref:hypothetical protein n=1 Tax=Pseudomonas sp. GD03944 TaxID=2975409 RepID=UPI00244C3D22|nr:hypothetical protein [Pseudomonas sp. GD03944]MDH1262043.1 hypothetical protein [Pseudomonas sp. GD03944]